MRTPAKIARDLAALIGIAKASTSLDKIDSALVEARERVSAACRECDAAEVAYRAALLDEPVATLTKLQERRAAAAIERDRAEALVTALTDRLAATRAADERAARKAVHDEATAKADAIRARFANEYSHHAGALRALLRDLAEAEVARIRAGQEAAEFGEIEPVEDAIRGTTWTPQEVVSVETRRLWVIDGRVEPIPADRVADVRSRTGPEAGPDKGVLPYATTTNAGAWPVTRRSFRVTRVREALGFPNSESLLRTIALPSLHPHGDDFITPEPMRGVDTALAHLSAERRPDPVTERPIVERLELLPDEPAPRERVVPFERREPDPVRSGSPSAAEIRAAHDPAKLAG